MVSASTNGLMVDATKASGAKTTWKDLASTIGATVECTLANTSTTRSMVMEFTAGKTAESMKVTGTSASSTVLVSTLYPRMHLSPSLVSGRTVKGSNGFLRRRRTKLIKANSTINSTINCLRIRSQTFQFKSSINPMISRKVGQM